MIRAIILAAGRGERMRPLTDTIPKPLIAIKNKSLIIYHLEKLARAGIKEVVINISYLADKIKDFVGDGSKYGIKIIYSYEPEVLETGGGIFQALPFLGPEPFLVISADIYTDYDYGNLLKNPLFQGFSPSVLGHLVLAPVPDYLKNSDFSLDSEGFVSLETPCYTYANIGIYRPELFKSCKSGHFPLGPLLKKAVENHEITGEIYKKLWYNLGSLEELKKLQG